MTSLSFCSSRFSNRSGMRECAPKKLCWPMPFSHHYHPPVFLANSSQQPDQDRRVCMMMMVHMHGTQKCHVYNKTTLLQFTRCTLLADNNDGTPRISNAPWEAQQAHLIERKSRNGGKAVLTTTQRSPSTDTRDTIINSTCTKMTQDIASSRSTARGGASSSLAATGCQPSCSHGTLSAPSHAHCGLVTLRQCHR